jgi:4-nitrophenyl phosphatase
MYRFALERLGTSASETMIVGDRLETDIAGAQALGSPCALVLSGVSTNAEAEAWQPAPQLIATDLAEVLAKWRWRAFPSSEER